MSSRFQELRVWLEAQAFRKTLNPNDPNDPLTLSAKSQNPRGGGGGGGWVA